jgi:MFS family permease
MQALKTPAFWMLTIAQVASSVAIVTLALHLVPKLTDTGMSLTAAASVHTTYTLVALPAQFISGYYADRLPKTLMIAFFMFVQGVGILIIALFDTVIMAYVFALLYGIGFGGRSPLTTAIRGEYFGRKAFATIMGVSQFPMNIAMIFAPLFAGYMFDTTGTYIVPFTTFAGLTLAGGVLMLFVRKPEAPLGTVRTEPTTTRTST